MLKTVFLPLIYTVEQAVMPTGSQGQKFADDTGKILSPWAEEAFQKQANAGKCVIHTAWLTNPANQVLLEVCRVFPRAMNQPRQITAGSQRDWLQRFCGIFCGAAAVFGNSLLR